MSSTRHAKDSTIYHQNRYASSSEYERGLNATLVAKRCSVIDEKEKRELIWFLQYLSKEDGGLRQVALNLIARYPEDLQTSEMVKIGMKPGKMCTLIECYKIRDELNNSFIENSNAKAAFPLKGDPDYSEVHLLGLDSIKPKPNNSLPDGYDAQAFLDFCANAADCNLDRYLNDLCVNPATSVNYGPWYFPRLIERLSDFKSDYIQRHTQGEFSTEIGRKVCETLDYTDYCQGLTLVEGGPRIGKSHAAKAWCNRNPGIRCFVEVPVGNDDLSFYQHLARGLRLGNFTSYKTVQIRERVESVLLTKDITLVLDEAHRLWPQGNYREGYPKRVSWVMSIANAGVPICMISTPQFFNSQKLVEKNGWNSAQLTGRLSHYESLQTDLSETDLVGVAKIILPEVSDQVLKVLAIYARSSARYLAAINSISTRARYIAEKSGRKSVATDDVKIAMRESVLPSDEKLLRAIETGRKRTRGQRSEDIAVVLPNYPRAVMDAEPERNTTSLRNISPLPTDVNRIDTGELMEL